MTFPHKILRELKPNWNSYGAPVIDTRCIEKAFELWRHLPPGDWQVVPCVDGGVQIEQHRDGFDIEITVSPASAQETVVQLTVRDDQVEVTPSSVTHCDHGVSLLKPCDQCRQG